MSAEDERYMGRRSTIEQQLDELWQRYGFDSLERSLDYHFEQKAFLVQANPC